jgi:MFS transporter, FHS family, L-fucose permease
MMFVKPRIVLMVFMTAIMILIAAAIGVKGEGGVAMLSLALFFESCIFPTIFTRSIRGLGWRTKRGSSWIVSSVSGGALIPSLTSLLADGRDYHVSMAVPLCGFFVAFAYSIYLNTFCRKELDGFRQTKIGWRVIQTTSCGEQVRGLRRKVLWLARSIWRLEKLARRRSDCRDIRWLVGHSWS